MFHSFCWVLISPTHWWMDQAEQAGCLVLRWGRLPVQRRSPIEALTRPGVDQLHWLLLQSEMTIVSKSWKRLLKNADLNTDVITIVFDCQKSRHSIHILCESSKWIDSGILLVRLPQLIKSMVTISSPNHYDCIVLIIVLYYCVLLFYYCILFSPLFSLMATIF